MNCPLGQGGEVLHAINPTQQRKIRNAETDLMAVPEDFPLEVRGEEKKNSKTVGSLSPKTQCPCSRYLTYTLPDRYGAPRHQAQK